MPNDKTNLLKETSVFDYVAGNLSQRARNNFEKLIKQDADLRTEVHVETELRKALISQNQNEPTSVSRANFNVLLEQIDKQENQLNEVPTVSAVNLHDSLNEQLPSESSAWFSIQNKTQAFAMAASVVMVAIVLVFGINSTIEPKFETLTSTQALPQIDLPTMVEQRRLAKLEIVVGLDDASLQSLLRDYGLSSVQAGADGQSILVSSALPIDNTLIQQWRNDKRVANAELVSFSSK